MFKKVAISIMSLLLLVSATSCSSDDKKDSKSSDDTKSSSSVSVSDFEDAYNEACDGVDEDIIQEIQDIDFETISSDEFDEKFGDALDEYKKFSSELDDIEVPSKFEDDWDEYKDLGDDQEAMMKKLKPSFLDLLDILEELRNTDQTDVEAIQELQDQAEAINSELEDISSDGDKLESRQEDLRDKMNLEDCLSD